MISSAGTTLRDELLLVVVALIFKLSTFGSDFETAFLETRFSTG